MAKELTELTNIGPTIAKRLNSVGVFSRADLERIGAVEAFRRIRDENPGKTVPVCYYLYSLQGALMDLHWDSLPEDLKSGLVEDASADPR